MSEDEEWVNETATRQSRERYIELANVAWSIRDEARELWERLTNLEPSDAEILGMLQRLREGLDRIEQITTEGG